MCTLGGAQSTRYPMGKSYAIGRLLGSRTHVMASADDPRTMAYRNAMVHLEVKEGQTATAHETIFETMEVFLHTDPEQLLEEHRHLLFSDFAAKVTQNPKI
jgi:hypothetical protein